MLHTFSQRIALCVFVLQQSGPECGKLGFKHFENWPSHLCSRSPPAYALCSNAKFWKYRKNQPLYSMTNSLSRLIIAWINYYYNYVKALAVHLYTCSQEGSPLYSRNWDAFVAMQCETYRRMNRITKGRWAEHFPQTNSMWIRYLTEVVMKMKQFPVSREDKQKFHSFGWAILSDTSDNLHCAHKLNEFSGGETGQKFAFLPLSMLCQQCARWHLTALFCKRGQKGWSCIAAIVVYQW